MTKSQKTNYKKHQNLPRYSSLSESDNEQQISNDFPLQHRKSKRVRSWNKECEFSSKNEALVYIQSDGDWSIAYTNSTSDGKKVYYRCKQMMRRGPQCDAAIYLLYCSFAPSVHLYRADCQHSCKFNLQVSQRLSLAMKEEIISLYQNQRMKPKKIYEVLKSKGYLPKNVTQISNCLQDFKRHKFKSTAQNILNKRKRGRPQKVHTDLMI